MVELHESEQAALKAAEKELVVLKEKIFKQGNPAPAPDPNPNPNPNPKALTLTLTPRP